MGSWGEVVCGLRTADIRCHKYPASMYGCAQLRCAVRECMRSRKWFALRDEESTEVELTGPLEDRPPTCITHQVCLDKYTVHTEQVSNLGWLRGAKVPRLLPKYPSWLLTAPGRWLTTCR